MTYAYNINQKSRSIRTISRECCLRDSVLRGIGCMQRGLEDRFWDDGKGVPIPFIISPEINRVSRNKRVDSIHFVCSGSDTAC